LSFSNFVIMVVIHWHAFTCDHDQPRVEICRLCGNEPGP